jgi:hypothetical protein
MANWIKGTELSAAMKREALARFINRYTGDHTPAWVMRSKEYVYPVQFADDADWLAHTYFAVTAKGTFDGRIHHCESHPTWPNGNQLKKKES